MTVDLCHAVPQDSVCFVVSGSVLLVLFISLCLFAKRNEISGWVKIIRFKIHKTLSLVGSSHNFQCCGLSVKVSYLCSNIC